MLTTFGALLCCLAALSGAIITHTLDKNDGTDGDDAANAGQPVGAKTQGVALAAPIPPATPATYRHLADETETSLRQNVLAKWFPQSVDTTRGGFHQYYHADWTPAPGDDKSIVYQARLTWTAAQAALRYPAEAETYCADVRHGLTFLADTLWDKQSGGFYWAVGATGQPDTDRKDEKHVYGVSFGLYAACAAFEATKDARALDLAKRAFQWLETNAHDGKNKGYYEALTRDNKLVLASSASPSNAPSDPIGTHYGYKSMNTHIHLLEAFTALYEIWPNAKVRTRLEELFLLVRDRIAVAPGCLNLFFTPDWRPIPDHDSFGHDVETAYLLVEAAGVLGKPDDKKTWDVARSIVDHALEYGWDKTNGGFYDSGTAFGTPSVTDKIWWVEAEGLNALLLMHERYGRETPRYWEMFCRQWAFIRRHQIDPAHGGWFPTVREDNAPIPDQNKSDAWTESYHQGRALLNVSAGLRRLAGEKPTAGTASSH